MVIAPTGVRVSEYGILLMLVVLILVVEMVLVMTWPEGGVTTGAYVWILPAVIYALLGALRVPKVKKLLVLFV